MLDWDKLRIFYAVAQAGSFTRAGFGLNLSQSAVSRQISALEDQLKIPLFHRHARGLVLTEQGEILQKTAQEIFTRLSAAENAITDSRDRPKGPLKVTAPLTLGTTWLSTHLHQFMEIYPEIQLSILVDDREFDLSMREADIAIRFTKPTHPDLIHKHLTTVKNSIYASKAYAAKHALPTKAEDLDKHRLIIFGEDYRAPFAGINWLTKVGITAKSENRSYFRINSLFAMMKAVETGIGIAALPDYMTKDNPQLIHVLKDLEGPTADLYFVYPTELRNSKRVRVFRDFIVSQVSDIAVD